MRSVTDRYATDPHFRTLVDTLYCAIERADFTPTEIREAAMCAQIKFENLHPRGFVFGEYLYEMTRAQRNDIAKEIE